MTSAALTPGYAGHPEADLLADLAAELNRIGPVVVAFGAQADAETSTAPRVFFVDRAWCAKSRKLQPPQGTAYAGHIGGSASYESNRIYDVEMYASDMGSLLRLWHAVLDKLDYLLSWTGFEAGDTTKPGPMGTGPGAAGFGLTMPLTIKGPIYRTVYGTAAATTVTPGTFVSDAASGGQSPVPPTT